MAVDDIDRAQAHFDALKSLIDNSADSELLWCVTHDLEELAVLATERAIKLEGAK